MIQQSAFLSASPKQALEVPHYGHCVLLLQRAARICGSNLKKKKEKDNVFPGQCYHFQSISEQPPWKQTGPITNPGLCKSWSPYSNPQSFRARTLIFSLPFFLLPEHYTSSPGHIHPQLEALTQSLGISSNQVFVFALDLPLTLKEHLRSPCTPSNSRTPN